jgi:hypothetical protein
MLSDGRKVFGTHRRPVFAVLHPPPKHDRAVAACFGEAGPTHLTIGLTIERPLLPGTAARGAKWTFAEAVRSEAPRVDIESMMLLSWGALRNSPSLLLGGRGYRQDARHFPAAGRLNQNQIHQEPGRL